MASLAEQITRAYEREQRENRQAVAAGDIPVSYDAISDAWLTHLLCREHPGARVTAYRLDGADDGGTNRRRIFVDYNAAGQAAGLPPSIFCKASHALEKRLLLAALGFIQGEVRFYRDYRPLLDIDAPRCLLATYDPESFNSIIVFDDLARDGAQFCAHDTPVTRQRAESQLALLAKLHGRFHGSAELKASTLPTFDGYFYGLDSFISMEKFCNDGFRLAEAVIPARLFARYPEVWPATVASVALHRTLPLTFAHNDPHLRNWYIVENGSMVLCDWQNFGGAHWGRDVAYTLSSSLAEDDRRAWERDLMRFYLDRLAAAGGPREEVDAAWRHYRQHLLSALAWWTSTLAIGTTQPRDACMAIIGRIATAIDDLDALDAF